MKTPTFPLLVLTLLLFLCGDLWSQSTRQLERSKDSTAFRYSYPEHIFEESKWRLSLPVWVPGFRGSFAYGEVEIDPEYGIEPPDSRPGVDRKLRKSELSISFYLLGDVKFQYGRFLIEADGMSATLDKRPRFTDAGIFDFGGTIDATILMAFAGYEVYQSMNRERLTKWSLWAYAGARYYKVHVFADNRSLLDVRPVWTDPLLGLRIPFVLRRWVFTAQGDIGGFGINGRRSYYLSANARYRFSRLFSLSAGWSQIDVEYDSEYKEEPMVIGMQLSGPAVRFSFDF